MLLSSKSAVAASCQQRPPCSTPAAAKPKRAGVAVRTQATALGKRDLLLAGLASAAAALLSSPQQSSAAGLSGSSTSSTSTSSTASAGSSISISPINSAAKETLDRRDSAMEYRCKGGMFDCDGDRREFARAQYSSWLSAGGVPKRLREGRPDGPRAY